MNIRQISRAKPTLLVAATATSFLPPSGGGRLGWGRLLSLRQNQIYAARKATLSPALSRRTGEGGRSQVKTRSSENLEIRVLEKLVPPRFQTTSFIQSTQAWDNSSSVGFAHEINKNTAILRMNIQQVSWAKPTLLVAATATCPFPRPAGEG